jgi:hypothetical protein
VGLRGGDMDERVVDYHVFLGLTNNVTAKRMTVTHNKFMSQQTVDDIELQQYSIALCAMAKYLQSNKHTKSIIQPQWHVRDMSCNCYLFEVMMRGNQYMMRVIDSVQDNKEFMSYLETATNGPVLAGKMICDEVPVKHHETIITLQRALGIGYFIKTVCIPMWTDLPTGYIDDDLKESIDYYNVIRSVLLLHASVLLVMDKGSACATAWTANTLIRNCISGSASFRESISKQSSQCAMWMGAKMCYDNGKFGNGALLLNHVTTTTTTKMPEWAHIMTKTRGAFVTVPSLDVLLKEQSTSDRMIIGTDPASTNNVDLFTLHITGSGDSKTVT